MGLYRICISLMTKILSTCLGACVPPVHLLLGSIHMLCPVSFGLFVFILSNYEFFAYFRYKSFIRYMFWKYFLPGCGLPFHFLISVFWRVMLGQNALSVCLWVGLACSYFFKDFCLYVNEKISTIASCAFFLPCFGIRIKLTLGKHSFLFYFLGTLVLFLPYNFG